jgi:hypothetical protein
VRTNGNYKLEQFLDFGLVETEKFFLAFNDHRPFQQVRVFEHELDRLFFRWGLLLHILFAIQGRASIQEGLDGIVADNLPQFLLCERVLAVFAFLEIDFLCLQETSCFATGGSGRFVNKSDFFSHRYPFI